MAHRRQFLQQSLAVGLTGFGLNASLQAQMIDQVRILYGFPAGSGGDITARRIADKLAGSAYSKNAAIVENRPGAGGRIALDGLRAAAPDGATLAMSPFSCTSIYPHIYSKLSYDPVRDFVPVGTSAYIHHGLAIGPAVPASVKTVREFVAWAKANPAAANYGSPAAGSTPHFIGALLGINQGVELKHIPYRGSVPGITDVVGGQVAAMFTPSGDFLPNHRAGRLRVIATSGQARSPYYPDVATFAEQGFPDLTVEEWFGFYAPARTPAPVIAAANAAINAALKDPAVIEGIGVVGLIARGSTPEAMAASQKAEFDRWGPLVKKIGFTAES
jgi:tripartite-type tricarboxylate transporter receptor subunit TctC